MNIALDRTVTYHCHKLNDSFHQHVNVFMLFRSHTLASLHFQALR